MLPNDPYPPPRSRSRKHKHGPKKQPQRGLGVAQLEKLRLQEQSKQQEAAACRASLHHHLPPLSDNALSIPDRHHLHQQVCLSHSLTLPLNAGSFHVIGPPSARTTIQQQQQQQQQQQSQPLGVALPPCTKLNCEGNGINSFLAFPGLTLAEPPRRTLRIGITEQGVENNEACLSSLSQIHDLCSPRSGTSSTISLSEQSSCHASPIWDKGKRFMIDDSRGRNARHNSPTFLSSILPSQAQAEAGPMRIQDAGMKSEILWGNAKELVTSLFPVMDPSKEKGMQGSVGAQDVQNQGGPLLFTDLRLFDFALGPSSNAQNQPRNHDEASVTTTSPAAAESLELSSFQNISTDQGWSLSDQISSRKRPWIFMQETTRNLVDLKGMFLNALVEENQSEFSEQYSSDTDTGLVRVIETPTSTSIYRSAAALRNSRDPAVMTGLFPMTIPEKNDCFPCLANKFRPDCGSHPERLPLQLCSLSSNFRKDCFSTPSDASSLLTEDKITIPLSIESNDFLTLGLSTSLCGMHEQLKLNTGSQDQQYTGCDIGKMEEVQVLHGGAAAAATRPQNPCPEQGKGMESKGRLQPWMVSRVLSTGEEYGSSIQLSMGLLSGRSSTSKAMYEEVQRRREVEEEQQHKKSVTCLDLNLKLSL